MGGGPIIDERWTAGGTARPATPAPARPVRHRAPRPPVAPEDVRLTVSVVWVGTLAEQEARDLGHDRLGTEHLLLALLRLGDAAGRRLTSHGVDLADVRRAVERGGAPGAMDNANGRPGWSTAASGAVRAARVAAGADGRPEVSGRDLLAAMLVPGGRAAAVLAELGVDAGAVLEPPAAADPEPVVAPPAVPQPVTPPSTGAGQAEAGPAEAERAGAGPADVPPAIPEQASAPRAAAVA